MIIIGVDPGTASTGFAIVRGQKLRTKREKIKSLKCLNYGLIQTNPAWTSSERLKKLNNDLTKLIEQYQPKVLATENVYFFKNLKTAIPVSQAGGVILLTAAKKKVPVYEFTPLQVKMAITGYGWAEKKEVQKKIKTLLKLKEIPRPDDAADALAIGLAYFLKGA